MKKKKTKDKVGLGSSFDPFGSYTGKVMGGKYERPVQDADDL